MREPQTAAASPLALTGTPSRAAAVSLAVVLFAALTAAGAYVAVPLGFTPVPMTLQTLFVLLAGVALGPAAGAASQLLYLSAGVVGVPVFAAGGAGLPWVLGPTGGYLMAFPVAAALTGWIAGREGAVLRTAVGLLVGTAAIFALGAAWLSVTGVVGSGQLFAVAVAPFLVGAVLKAAIALAAARPLSRLAGGRPDRRGRRNREPGPNREERPHA